MINYAASINQNTENNIEKEQAKKEIAENPDSNINGSEKLDVQFREILRR